MNVRELVSALMQYDMEMEVKCVRYAGEEIDESEVAMPVQEIGDDDDNVLLYFVSDEQ